MMIRINKKEYTDARKRIRSFIKKHNRLPNYCQFVTNEKKEVDLNKEEYCGLFEGYMTFYMKNGREPNYLTLNSKDKNSIVQIMNYQDDKYSCCPTSLQMCMMFLFEYKSEAYVKKVLGTNKNGTSPAMLIDGAKKLGYKVTPISRDFKEVKRALSQYKPVIMHIETKPSQCLGYLNNYGHFLMCYKVGDTTYYLADPTKGLRKCKFTDINKATNGRNLKYYTVEIA